MSPSSSSPEASVSGTRKRKVVSYQSSSSDPSSLSYVTVSTGDAGIEIHEVDADARFIRLYNRTDKVILVPFKPFLFHGNLTLCYYEGII